MEDLLLFTKNVSDKNGILNAQLLAEDGYSQDNLQLLDAQKYWDDVKIQQMFDYDKDKFLNTYNHALAVYNNLADPEYKYDYSSEVKYYKESDVESDPDKLIDPTKLAPTVSYEPNPMMTMTGMLDFNERTESPFTASEIGQAHKTYDIESGKYIDSPNDRGFFRNLFGGTMVLDTYDEDGYHFDRVLGINVPHKKGDLVEGDEGTAHFKMVNGEDIFGKTVLNPFSTITVDGSAADKYAFWDNDDKEKSVIGSTVSTIVRLAPFFITRGKIGDRYAKMLLLDTTADFVQRLIGDIADLTDNTPENSEWMRTMNRINGWFRRRDRGSSQYSQDNLFTYENVMNLLSDVVEQQYMMRAPMKWAMDGMKVWGKSLTQEGKIISEINKNRERWTAAREGEIFKEMASAASKERALITGMTEQELKLVANLRTQEEIARYFERAAKTGSNIGRIWMTGYAAQNTYNEARHEGASRGEAAAMALIFTAAEYAIMRTGLGERLFPELQRNQSEWNASIKKVIDEIHKAGGLSSNNPAIRSKITKNLLDGALRNKGPYANGIKGMLLNATAEGVEEMTEEFVQDAIQFAESLKSDNYKKDILGDAAERYAMAFFGGFLGGGIFGFDSSFRNAKSIQNMSVEQAYANLIRGIRNGKKDDIIKELNKMTVGSKTLSLLEAYGVGDEVSYFKPADKYSGIKSQDAEIKSRIIDMINFAATSIDGTGAKSDSELDKELSRDLRYSKLMSSTSMEAFYKSYDEKLGSIVATDKEIANLRNEIDNSDGETLNAKRDELRRLEEQKKSLIDEFHNDFEYHEEENVKGPKISNQAKKYLEYAYWEMTNGPRIFGLGLSTQFIAEQLAGVTYDEMSESERKVWEEKARALKSADGGRFKIDRIIDSYSIAKNMLDKFCIHNDSLFKGLSDKFASNKYIVARLNDSIVNLIDTLNSDKTEDFSAALGEFFDVKGLMEVNGALDASIDTDVRTASQQLEQLFGVRDSNGEWGYYDDYGQFVKRSNSGTPKVTWNESIEAKENALKEIEDKLSEKDVKDEDIADFVEKTNKSLESILGKGNKPIKIIRDASGKVDVKAMRKFVRMSSVADLLTRINNLGIVKMGSDRIYNSAMMLKAKMQEFANMYGNAVATEMNGGIINLNSIRNISIMNDQLLEAVARTIGSSMNGVNVKELIEKIKKINDFNVTEMVELSDNEIKALRDLKDALVCVRQIVKLTGKHGVATSSYNPISFTEFLNGMGENSEGYAVLEYNDVIKMYSELDGIGIKIDVALNSYDSMNEGRYKEEMWNMYMYRSEMCKFMKFSLNRAKNSNVIKKFNIDLDKIIQNLDDVESSVKIDGQDNITDDLFSTYMSGWMAVEQSIHEVFNADDVKGLSASDKSLILGAIINDRVEGAKDELRKIQERINSNREFVIGENGTLSGQQLLAFMVPRIVMDPKTFYGKLSEAETELSDSDPNFIALSSQEESAYAMTAFLADNNADTWQKIAIDSVGMELSYAAIDKVISEFKENKITGDSKVSDVIEILKKVQQEFDENNEIKKLLRISDDINNHLDDKVLDNDFCKKILNAASEEDYDRDGGEFNEIIRSYTKCCESFIIYPRCPNVFMQMGAAGTGKSTYLLKLVDRIIVDEKKHSDFDLEIEYIHVNKENAINAKNKIGGTIGDIDDAYCYSRTDRMKKLVGIEYSKDHFDEYGKPLGTFHGLPVIDGKVKNDTYTDSNTTTMYMDNGIVQDESGNYFYKTANRADGRPLIMFVDEFTLMNDVDMNTLVKMCPNAKIILLGDVAQNTVTGRHPRDVNYSFQIKPNTYWHAAKMNLPMRAETIQKRVNNRNVSSYANTLLKVQEFMEGQDEITLDQSKQIEEALKGENAFRLALHYYRSDDGKSYSGDYFYASENSPVKFKLDEDTELVKNISAMIERQKDINSKNGTNSKIIIAENDSLSDTLQKEIKRVFRLNNSEFDALFEVTDVSNSQGTEADFYIAMNNQESNVGSFGRRLNTCITRGKRGTVFIQPRLSQRIEYNDNTGNNHKCFDFSNPIPENRSIYNIKDDRSYDDIINTRVSDSRKAANKRRHIAYSQALSGVRNISIASGGEESRERSNVLYDLTTEITSRAGSSDMFEFEQIGKLDRDNPDVYKVSQITDYPSEKVWNKMDSIFREYKGSEDLCPLRLYDIYGLKIALKKSILDKVKLDKVISDVKNNILNGKFNEAKILLESYNVYVDKIEFVYRQSNNTVNELSKSHDRINRYKEQSDTSKYANIGSSGIACRIHIKNGEYIDVMMAPTPTPALLAARLLSQSDKPDYDEIRELRFEGAHGMTGEEIEKFREDVIKLLKNARYKGNPLTDEQLGQYLFVFDSYYQIRPDNKGIGDDLAGRLRIYKNGGEIPDSWNKDRFAYGIYYTISESKIKEMMKDMDQTIEKNSKVSNGDYIVDRMDPNDIIDFKKEYPYAIGSPIVLNNITNIRGITYSAGSIIIPCSTDPNVNDGQLTLDSLLSDKKQLKNINAMLALPPSISARDFLTELNKGEHSVNYGNQCGLAFIINHLYRLLNGKYIFDENERQVIDGLYKHLINGTETEVINKAKVLAEKALKEFKIFKDKGITDPSVIVSRNKDKVYDERNVKSLIEEENEGTTEKKALNKQTGLGRFLYFMDGYARNVGHTEDMSNFLKKENENNFNTPFNLQYGKISGDVKKREETIELINALIFKKRINVPVDRGKNNNLSYISAVDFSEEKLKKLESFKSFRALTYIRPPKMKVNYLKMLDGEKAHGNATQYKFDQKRIVKNNYDEAYCDEEKKYVYVQKNGMFAKARIKPSEGGCYRFDMDDETCKMLKDVGGFEMMSEARFNVEYPKEGVVHLEIQCDNKNFGKKVIELRSDKEVIDRYFDKLCSLISSTKKSIETFDITSLGKTILENNNLVIRDRHSNGHIRGGQSGWKLRFIVKNPKTGKAFTTEEFNKAKEDYYSAAKPLLEYLKEYFSNPDGSDVILNDSESTPIAHYKYKDSTGKIREPFKFLSGGEVGESDFTIYIGSMEDVQKFIQDIENSPIVDLLAEGNNNKSDTTFTNKIHGRIEGRDIGFTGYMLPGGLEKMLPAGTTLYEDAKVEIKNSEVGYIIKDKITGKWESPVYSSGISEDSVSWYVNKHILDIRNKIAENIYGEYITGKPTKTVTYTYLDTEYKRLLFDMYHKLSEKLSEKKNITIKFGEKYDSFGDDVITFSFDETKPETALLQMYKIVHEMVHAYERYYADDESLKLIVSKAVSFIKKFDNVYNDEQIKVAKEKEAECLSTMFHKNVFDADTNDRGIYDDFLKLLNGEVPEESSSNTEKDFYEAIKGYADYTFIIRNDSETKRDISFDSLYEEIEKLSTNGENDIDIFAVDSSNARTPASDIFSTYKLKKGCS